MSSQSINADAGVVARSLLPSAPPSLSSRGGREMRDGTGPLLLLLFASLMSLRERTEATVEEFSEEDLLLLLFVPFLLFDDDVVVDDDGRNKEVSLLLLLLGPGDDDPLLFEEW